VRRLAIFGAVGAALAALAAPAATLGAKPTAAQKAAAKKAAAQKAAARKAAGTLTLSQNPDSAFPDKSFTLTIPQKRALTARQVTVTEDGSPVQALSVEPPGGNATGAILLIDASESMQGTPIKNAMAAARAFMVERKPDMPVAVIAFNPDVNVLTDFTTDTHTLAVSVGKAPPIAYGTHIYDALVKAADLAKAKGLERTTVVLLSDGQELGSNASLADAETALAGSNVRVLSVGLKSPKYNSVTLRTIAQRSGGAYVESATSLGLIPIFRQIGARLAREYTVRYRSLLPPKREAVVSVSVAGYSNAAKATYTTPAIDFAPKGTFARGWLDSVILSGWVMVFMIVAILGLLAFAVLTALEVRNRSLPRRMAAYVSVPSEDESRVRRAEVTAMLADKAQQRIAGHRWWQSFVRDVELGDWSVTPVTLAGWTLLGGVLASLVAAVALKSLLGLLVGLVAPFVTRYLVSRRVTKKRAAFAESLPENVDVIAGSLRAGHSLIGAMNVMVEDANEPSKSEFRRVLQDEQLGVPIDEALTVMARRMDNPDVEQVALVTRLQREAGGNTAEVLDRVVETMRGRMELRRLVTVLTAQNRYARWILTGLPIALLIMIMFTTPSYLQPLFHTTVGVISLVAWVVMLAVGSFWIKRITTMEV
jgi:tight adherence protein B